MGLKFTRSPQCHSQGNSKCHNYTASLPETDNFTKTHGIDYNSQQDHMLPSIVRIVDRQLIGFSDASERAYFAMVHVRGVDTVCGACTHISRRSQNQGRSYKKSFTTTSWIVRCPFCSSSCKAPQSCPWNSHQRYIYAYIYGQYHCRLLYWIYGTSQRLKTFEANRVFEIQEYLLPERWKHVKGNENLADASSRGILPKDIL